MHFYIYSFYNYFLKLFIAGGQAKTLMFVQINPDVESYSETISTLKFAERVSGVELGAARSNKEGKDMKELLEQVFILQLLSNSPGTGV
jgi:kinesin family protein C2/C3